MKQSKVRYSRAALFRTIRNRLVEAEQDSIVQTITILRDRAKSAVGSLKEALDAIENSDTKLKRDSALVILGRLMRPGLGQGATAAILALRQDVTAGTLDERTETKALGEALTFAISAADTARAAALPDEVERWTWVVTTLSALDASNRLQGVNVDALWRYSEHAVYMTTPVDKIAGPR